LDGAVIYYNVDYMHECSWTGQEVILSQMDRTEKEINYGTSM